MKQFVAVIAAMAAAAGMSSAAPFPVPDDPYRPVDPYKPAPAPYNPPPKVYAPKQAYRPAKYGADEKLLPPQPYKFEYGVSDYNTGTNYKAAEAQDEAGVVIGEYTVNLPDGRKQTVTYRADHDGGFVADVRYEGEAVYPPEPKEGYGNAYRAQAKSGGPGRPAPRYRPAPPPEPVKYSAPPSGASYVPAPPSYKDN